MKVSWLLIIFVIVLVSGYFLFSSQGPATNQSQAGEDGKNYGGTVVIGITGDLDTFNPLYTESSLGQEITHLVLLGLADLNENLEFEPELASSWESSPDNLELTYHLRKDAVWSDGVPITAEDVKFTFDLLKDTLVASPNQGVADFIKKVVVEDSFTVTFQFTQAYPTEIFDTAGEILPKHILENADRSSLREHPFGRQPVASGPFKLKRWLTQQVIELVPNEKYFANRPYLDRVVFKIVPNDINLLTQLKTGEVDVVMGVPVEEVSQIEKENPNINISQVSGRVYHYVGYNEANPLFADVNIRRALTMAINRNEIIDGLLYGFGQPCFGHLPPMIKWAYNSDIQPIPYDPKLSEKIFQKAGWTDSDNDGWLDRNGKDFEFVLETNSGNQLKSDVAVVIQEQLRKVGVKVKIEALEWSAYLDDLRNGDFDAHVGAWSTSLYIDPTPVFHSSATNMFNWTRYSNPAVDQLIETGREEMDQAKAAVIWKDMQRLIYEDQPYTFLYWIDKVVAVNNRFQNVNPIPLSSLYKLEKWYIKSSDGLLSAK